MQRNRNWGNSAVINGNAGQRDPRLMTTPAYAPRIASDLQAASEIERELARSKPSGLDYLLHKVPQFQYQPLPIVEAMYPGSIPAAGIANAFVLVPKNPNRKAMKISNPGKLGGLITGGGDLSFCYNSPVGLPNGAGSGIIIPAGSPPYQETNGVISVDSIYVWSDDPFATFPIGVVAWEGIYLGGS